MLMCFYLFRCTYSFPLLLLLLVTGCGGGSSLIPVTGTITVDGKPADGALILFHPEAGEFKSISSAVASADGSFKPVTNAEPGLPIGRFRLTVVWPDPAVKPTEKEILLGTDKSAPDLLKGRYLIREKSELTVDVTSQTTALPPLSLQIR
jgi:hypothetical protein